jgi:hypothetical protein
MLRPAQKEGNGTSLRQDVLTSSTIASFSVIGGVVSLYVLYVLARRCVVGVQRQIAVSRPPRRLAAESESV